MKLDFSSCHIVYNSNEESTGLYHLSLCKLIKISAEIPEQLTTNLNEFLRQPKSLYEVDNKLLPSLTPCCI